MTRLKGHKDAEIITIYLNTSDLRLLDKWSKRLKTSRSGLIRAFCRWFLGNLELMEKREKCQRK